MGDDDANGLRFAVFEQRASPTGGGANFGAGVGIAGPGDAVSGVGNPFVNAKPQASEERALSGRGFVEAIEPDFAMRFGKLTGEPLFTLGGGEPVIADGAAFELLRPSAKFGSVFGLIEGGMLERELVLAAESPGLCGAIGGCLSIEQWGVVNDLVPAAAFGKGAGRDEVREKGVNGLGDPVLPGADGGSGPGLGAGR